MELRKPDIALTTAKYLNFANPSPPKTPTEEDAKLFLSPKGFKKSWSAENHRKTAKEHHQCILNHRARHESPYPKLWREKITRCYRKSTLERHQELFLIDMLPKYSHLEHRKRPKERKECAPISLTPSESWRFLDAIERLCFWRLLPF